MIEITTRISHHNRTEIAFGEGGAHGYAKVALWGLRREEWAIDGLRARKDARCNALTARVAALMQADPECQAILEAEKADRTLPNIVREG